MTPDHTKGRQVVIVKCPEGRDISCSACGKFSCELRPITPPGHTFQSRVTTRPRRGAEEDSVSFT